MGGNRGDAYADGSDLHGDDPVGVARESLDVAKQAYSEANSDLESINNRLAAAIALLPVVAALVVFDTPLALATNELSCPERYTGALLYGVSIFLVVWGITDLVRGLRVQTTRSPYNLTSLNNQDGEDYATKYKFFRKQLANFTAYAMKLLELANAKGRRYNRGITLALGGLLLAGLLRIWLQVALGVQ